ncbi:MAG: acyl-CoA dehydrogenase family protein [Desulfobacterales bacterium]
MSLDLSLTKSEEMLKSTTLDFLEREIPRETLEALLDSDTGTTETILKKVADIGWLGLIIPEEYGGIGYPLTTAGVLFEALGSWPLPGPYFSSGILGSQIVMEAGTEEQKQQLLPEVATGNIVLTLALTEPEYSWDPEGVKATASSDADGFVLNGVKLFTPDAQAATYFIVVARTDRGISLLVVEKKTAGVKLRRLPGFLAGRTFEVTFDSVKVPSSALLGTMDEGWKALEKAITRSIPVLCAYKVGGCQAIFDLALKYSRERVQFSQPIGRFQRVQDMIIEMITHADAARWTTYEALWKLDTQQPMAESVHLAKAVASEAYWQVCTLGHRVFSGVSYSMEHTVSFHTRTSRHLYNVLGEPSYHRQQIAARLLS